MGVPGKTDRVNSEKTKPEQAKAQQAKPGVAKPGRAEGDDAPDVATTSGFVLPGGKVDADAIVRAAQQAREQGLSEGEDEALRRVRFQLKHDLQKRLDKYLTDRITFLSRTQLQRLIDDKLVLVNAVPAKASTKLRAGDVVELSVPAPASKDIQAEDIPLEVLFEDEHIIVINKQPGIIVHPARAENTGTMLGALAYHFKHRSSVGGGLSNVGWELARPGVVHRLDRDTTGVIVFAKTEEAHWKLGHGFEHRRVDKRYIALVHGHVEPDGFVIDLPLGPHQSREKGYREKQVVRHDELGKPSVTVVRVRERYGKGARPAGAEATPAADASLGSVGWKLPELPKEIALERENNNLLEADMHRFSLVELELKTGRTHQIRVHLAHNLWPIVGDDLYGGRPIDLAQLRSAGEQPKRRGGKRGQAEGAEEAGGRIERQMLHACMLSFEHPMSGTRMTFQAPLRDDMRRAVLAMRELAGAEVVTTPGAVIDLARVVVDERMTS
jgi:23S rRNA pseudouridine1911/1915/1917 synthase